MKKNIFIFICIFLFSCKKEEEKEVQYSQPNSAQHNSYILESRVNGEGGALTYFYGSVASGDGNSYYLSHNNSNGTAIQVIVGGNGQPISSSAVSDENYEVGKITTSGIKLWAKNNPFKTRGLLSTEWLTGQLQNGLVVVGFQNLPQTTIYKGRIGLYDKYGNLLKSITTNNDYTWLNSVSRINGTNTILGFGGQEINGIDYPFICSIAVESNGVIGISDEKAILSLPNSYFVRGKSINKDGVKYIACISKDEDKFIEIGAFGYNNDNIWKNRVSLPNMESDIWGVSDNLLVDNNNVYISCYTGDDTKQPRPSTGYWYSGLIRCYSINGRQLWETKIAPSNKGDYIAGIFIKDNYIWGIGAHSNIGWHNDPKKRFFQNGLLSKLDKNTGQIINNYTFSNSNGIWDSSAFYSNTLNNNFLNIFGRTNYHNASNVSNEWVIKLDINRL